MACEMLWLLRPFWNLAAPWRYAQGKVETHVSGPCLTSFLQQDFGASLYTFQVQFHAYIKMAGPRGLQGLAAEYLANPTIAVRAPHPDSNYTATGAVVTPRGPSMAERLVRSKHRCR